MKRRRRRMAEVNLLQHEGGALSKQGHSDGLLTKYSSVQRTSGTLVQLIDTYIAVVNKSQQIK